MKITVKNKDCCRTKNTYINQEFRSESEAASALFSFYDGINATNDDGVYVNDKDSILEMLEEEDCGESLEETTKKSLKEFCIETDAEAMSYFVIVEHGIRHFVPDNLLPEQQLSLAVDLVNSGDEMVEIIPDLELTFKHYNGNSQIFIGDDSSYNWVWSDCDLSEYESLQELIECMCDDLYKYVHSSQQEELLNKLVFEFTGMLFDEAWEQNQ